MRLFLKTVGRVIAPKKKMNDYQLVRGYLRYIRDYNLPEEVVEDLLDVSIKILMDMEIKETGGVPEEQFTKEDLLRRTKEQGGKLHQGILKLLEEPDHG